MTIPFREFTSFDERNLNAEDPDSHNYQAVSDWSPIQHPNRRRIGEECIAFNTHYKIEHPMIRIKNGNQAMIPTGLDKIVQFDLDVTWAIETWSGPDALLLTSFLFITTQGIVNTENSNVNWSNFSGRYKEKTGSVVWAGVIRGIIPAGPEYTTMSVVTQPRILSSDSFLDFKVEVRSSISGSEFFDVFQDQLANEFGGMWFRQLMQSGPPWVTYALQTGEGVYGIITPKVMTVRYFNPVVNAISKRIWDKDGGTAVILTGSNMQMNDAELNAYASPTLSWDIYVDEIDIIGLQGQGTTTLTFGGGDFTVDSEGQITIPSTPVLSPGTYEILLRSHDHTAGLALTAEQHAGDWRTDSQKRLKEGDRFVILVGDPEEVQEDDPGGSLILTDWTWKDPDGNMITEFLAPMDTRARGVFYHGRILSQTNFSREVNDRTGMFSMGDLTFELANNDKRYSALLATYFLKNQFVGVYHARRNHPEAWKTSLVKMIVDDYELEGNVFRVMCKDVTNKYFQITVPRYIINDDEYPNAHESVLGQPVPELLGLHTLGGKTPGAVEARLVDTTTFKYLASRGSLHSVPQVYSEGVLKTGGGVDYTISHEDGGRTYITFNSNQGEKKVTFNCTGYTHDPWNSVNGYVQNPAYVILFILGFILEIPQVRINLGSFDDVAATMGIMEVHTSGRWIGQEGQSGENVIQELLQTYGAKLFLDREGKLKLARKDVSNYTTDLFVFDQIHCLKPAKRTFGLSEAINVVKAKFDYYPTASLFKDVVEARNETAIENFESEKEPDSEFKLKWTDSPVLAQLRTVEELVKFSEGYFKGHFSLPFEMIDVLDIMDNFRFQDPFGIAADAGGEFGRYFYVVSLQPNHVDMTLEMIGIDLTWLISQESGSGSG